MLKAPPGLKMLHPRMVHFTCLAHGLHPVVENIRGNNSVVDSLIFNIKKVFLKAPLRVEKFKQEAPSLSLPPKAVLTRWRTWLDAAIYCCGNSSTLDKIVSELYSNKASSVKFLKKLYSSDLSGKLVYIKSKFLVVSKKNCLSGGSRSRDERCAGYRKGPERALQARGREAENVKTNSRKCWSEIMGFQKYVKLMVSLVRMVQHYVRKTQRCTARK
jgi:hypothetical protein